MNIRIAIDNAKDGNGFGVTWPIDDPQDEVAILEAMKEAGSLLFKNLEEQPDVRKHIGLE